MTVSVFAPAKINLTLHVTGQRDDGYHLLDSLVVFADIGDTVTAAPSDHLTMTMDGQYAQGLSSDNSNLVMQAARAFGSDQNAHLHLSKALPTASGIGGGSADAAATLLAVGELWNRPLPDLKTVQSLGADVPVCLAANPTRMSGIGEILAPVTNLPPLYFVLVNPGVEVSTPAVFAELSNKNNAPMPAELPQWKDTSALARWLGTQRNDLELPARSIVPAIGVVLSQIADAPGCLLARMSGSGATCFGLFDNQTMAQNAAQSIAKSQPDWWVTAAKDYARA